MSAKSKVVILMGAGAAASAGLSTLKGIVDGIHGATVPLSSDDPVIDLVKDSWKFVKGRRGDNATLEDLLALLKEYSRAADIVKEHHVFSEELKAPLPHVVNGQFKMRWESALAYCFKLIIENYGPHRVSPKDDGFLLIHEMLKLLAKHNGGRLDLFTTNYDCLLHVMAANVEDLTFYSHIEGKRGWFNSDWHAANLQRGKDAPAVYVHRLHGCVGWFWNSQSPYGVHEIYGSGGPRLSIEDPAKLNQMAIKLISEERLGRFPAFSIAFDELRDALATCSLLIVWGYSFRDTEVLANVIKVAEARRGRCFEIFYIDPYLKQSDVEQNMRNAVADLLIFSSDILKPQPIDWMDRDGPERLLTAVTSLIGQEPPRPAVRRAARVQ